MSSHFWPLAEGAGCLLFIFGRSIRAYLLLLHQVVATAVLYAFYNYQVGKKEFNQLFVKLAEYGI